MTVTTKAKGTHLNRVYTCDGCGITHECAVNDFPPDTWATFVLQMMAYHFDSVLCLNKWLAEGNWPEVWETGRRFDASGFATALRKMVDSKASAVAWNAIQLVTDEQWVRFINAVDQAEGSLEERCRSILIRGEAALNLLALGLEALEPSEYEVLEEWSWQEGDKNG